MSTLDNWVKVIRRTGKTGWEAFYNSMLAQPVSNIDLLMWAVDTYGDWAVIDAVTSAAGKKLNGDPLSYVLAVAQRKWKDTHVQLSEDGKYQRGIERSKRRTNERNEELEEKLRKAKET